MRRLLLSAGLFCALALSLSSAQAAPPGTLDPSFGRYGVVRTPVEGRAIAVQRNGRIVVAGSLSKGFGVARYLQNGALDPNFGQNGRVETTFGRYSVATAVLIQPDGKIIAAGSADEATTGNPDFALARYLSNGTLDPTFGQGGKLTTDFAQGDDAVLGLSLEPGGKILAAGFSLHQAAQEYDVALARYNSDGSLDQTFDDHGRVSTSAPVEPYGFAFQSDGKIVVSGINAGKVFGITRLNADGSIDRSFGTDGLASVRAGKGPYTYTTGVALQPDGKIVADGIGETGSREVFELARFTSSGSVDSSFGNQGSVRTGVGASAGAQALALDAKGRIAAVGWTLTGGSGVFAVARYLPDGSLDSGFGSRGVKRNPYVPGAPSAVTIQPNGRIVVTGGCCPGVVVRYLSSSHDLVCTVPKVKGRRLSAAKRAIRHGHCGVGRIQKAFSTRVAKGRVLAQRPRPGALRAPGSPVGLRVSKGRRAFHR